MKINQFSICEHCGTSQRTNPNHLLCSQCNAPFKVEELFAPIKAIVKPELSFSISVDSSGDWCVHSVDVSKWQGDINPTVYSNSDSKYMIIKAGQGNWKDLKSADNINMCLEHEFPFGLYHFADIRYSAKESAALFAQQANWLPGVISEDRFSKQTNFCKITFWLDVESTFEHSSSEMRAWIREFISEFTRLTGMKVGIYTRGYFWNDFVAPMDEIHELPLWVAHYNSWITQPYIPKDWSNHGETWVLWQYSADGNMKGSEYGVESYSIDLNRFNGDCDAFYRYFIGDGEIVEPPPPVEIECLQLEVVNCNNLNIRSEPSTAMGSASVLYALPVGSVVDVVNIIPKSNQVWIEIKPGEFAAMFYNGYQYLTKK